MSSGAAQLSNAVAEQMQALRERGASYNAIAAALNQSGVRGNLGGRWFPASVRRALQRVEGGLAQRAAGIQAGAEPDAQPDNVSSNETMKESQCKV